MIDQDEAARVRVRVEVRVEVRVRGIRFEGDRRV